MFRHPLLGLALLAGLSAGMTPAPVFAHSGDDVCSQVVRVPYEALNQGQRDVFADYHCEGSLEAIAEPVAWNMLQPQQQYTFYAITRAMQTLGILDLVAHFTQINGFNKTLEEPELYEVLVDWSPGAMTALTNRQFTDGNDSLHREEIGFHEPLGGKVGLHLLFPKSGSEKGRIHIDYRSAGMIQAVSHFTVAHVIRTAEGSGHFTKVNADFGACGPQVSKDDGRRIRNWEVFGKRYGLVKEVSSFLVSKAAK